ncbi:MAG: hypothetical protein PHQ84_03880 [Candidatus Omnitrophica bacterium]|jgi:hypothetical protein|nr:hypothetical protein [Candidatus Omnitrophota bacterium]MDD5078126.1 hypothetical protein [Candidatus Omnitrophota bacterium]MDD5724545.1 hypothetical protein [Candidatus Omnitrophota bacterium]
MKVGGWVFMLVSWSAIILLAVFCFSRVLGKRAGNGSRKNTRF